MASQVVSEDDRTRIDKARLIASIDSLPLGFILTDETNEIVLTNNALNYILGYSEKEPFKERLDRLLDLKKCCEECRKKRELVEIKDLLVEGKRLRMILNPVSVLGADEKVIGVVVLIEEVTH